MKTAAEEHYLSGEYWRSRADSRSEYKVQLAFDALRRAGVVVNNGDCVLEVGCGNGAFLIPFAEACARRSIEIHLTGCDVSAEGIEQGRRRAAVSPIEWLTTPIENVDKTYKFVFVMDVVEHVDSPNRFITECANRGEWLLLHLPIEQSVLHLFTRRPSASYRAYRHIHFYSVETARLLIEDY